MIRLFVAMCVWLFVLSMPSQGQSLHVFEEGVVVTAMSRSGDWIAGYQLTNGFEQIPFSWTATSGFQNLDLSLAVDPSFELPRYPLAIDDSGSLIVGHGESPRSRDSDIEVFRWTAAEGWDTLTASDSRFVDLSGDGRVVAGNFYRDDDPVDDAHHSFRWTDSSGVTQIPEVQIAEANHLEGWTTGMSAAGDVVVGYSVGRVPDAQRPVSEGFRWSETTSTVGLGALEEGHIGSRATAVSPDGQTVGGQSLTGTGRTDSVPFIWTEAEGISRLPTEARNLELLSISMDSKLILGSEHEGPFYIWDESRTLIELSEFLTMRSGIDMTGWDSLTNVRMSDNGQVFSGRGTNANGSYNDWRLSVVPEPRSVSSLVVAVLAMIAQGRRR